MLAAALFPGVAAAASGESFDEALLARPLPDGALQQNIWEPVFLFKSIIGVSMWVGGRIEG